MKKLKKEYLQKKEAIKSKLAEFRSIPEKEYFYEFLFCILTPQSNAKKCWSAIEEIKKLDKFNVSNLQDILKSRTRFHNNKSRYLLEAKSSWSTIYQHLNDDIFELRNWLADNVKGYGLKEASHFLRNIGKSNNKIAILDRHILKNLKSLGIIESQTIKNRKDYLEIEKRFIDFSKKISIPIDKLDLLFWSRENGEIFK